MILLLDRSDLKAVWDSANPAEPCKNNEDHPDNVEFDSLTPRAQQAVIACGHGCYTQYADHPVIKVAYRNIYFDTKGPANHNL
jgi:hypothetical protein